MSLYIEKAGSVHVRVGGNTQDTAFMVDSFPDGRIMEKDKEDASNPVRIVFLYSYISLEEVGKSKSPLRLVQALSTRFSCSTHHQRLDLHSSLGIHARPLVHAWERLQSDQLPLVPW